MVYDFENSTARVSTHAMCAAHVYDVYVDSSLGYETVYYIADVECSASHTQVWLPIFISSSSRVCVRGLHNFSVQILKW